ncbi:MAG: hypothetical protein LAO24_19180 [Acidobacteriia bacterium]|nr:hypothetical protein [Terriglobia bacterium]
MIPLSFVTSRGLTWSKAHEKDKYELTFHGEVAASLHRVNRWSATFLAESCAGRWAFRRTGFLGSDTEIVDLDSSQRIATFKANWSGGGTLAFCDGETFRFACRGVWRPVWNVLDDNGETVLHLDTRERTVDLVKEPAVNEGRLALLIIFAWHRMLQAAEDAAEVAVMAAAS